MAAAEILLIYSKIRKSGLASETSREACPPTFRKIHLFHFKVLSSVITAKDLIFGSVKNLLSETYYSIFRNKIFYNFS